MGIITNCSIQNRYTDHLSFNLFNQKPIFNLLNEMDIVRTSLNFKCISR